MGRDGTGQGNEGLRDEGSERVIVPSCTDFHNPDESSFERLMMPFAVPFRRKSASLTLLMNASFMTIPSASSRTSSSSGQSLKCTTRRHGNGLSWSSMSQPASSDSAVPLDAGSAPA